MWTDDAYVNETVTTESFVINFTKLGVVNVRDYTDLTDGTKTKRDVLNFKLEAPWLEKLQRKSGDVTV